MPVQQTPLGARRAVGGSGGRRIRGGGGGGGGGSGDDDALRDGPTPRCAQQLCTAELARAFGPVPQPAPLAAVATVGRRAGYRVQRDDAGLVLPAAARRAGACRQPLLRAEDLVEARAAPTRTPISLGTTTSTATSTARASESVAAMSGPLHLACASSAHAPAGSRRRADTGPGFLRGHGTCSGRTARWWRRWRAWWSA